MSKRKQKPSWQATLARLVAEVQAETKVPVPQPLRKAFAQSGQVIPIFEVSGTITPAELEEAFKVLKKES